MKLAGLARNCLFASLWAVVAVYFCDVAPCRWGDSYPVTWCHVH